MFPFQDDNPIRRLPLATFALIAANVAVFLGTWLLPPQRAEALIVHRGFIPARIAQLASGKSLNVTIEETQEDAFGGARRVAQRMELPADRAQILLSLLTCMFLHGGWMHVLGNMWFLWIFGDNVEDRLGVFRYLLLYVLGGMAASAAHWLHDPASTVPVIGASGAVAAVLGAYAITWPQARVHTLVFLVVFVTIVDLPALLVLGFWFVAQVLSGLRATAPGEAAAVAWWAHVGGFIAGAVLMLFLRGTTVREPEL